MCRAAKPMRSRPGREHRVGRQRAAGRVHLRRRRQPDRLGEDQLLMGERRVDLGHLDRAGVAAGRRLGRRRRRRGGGQVAGAKHRGLDAVLETGYPGGFSRSSRARSPAASTIADAPSVIGAMSWRRNGSAKYGRESSSSMRSWRASPSRCARRRRTSPARPGPSARRSTCRSPGRSRACRPAIDTASGHQRRDRVRVGLQRQHAAQHACRGLAEPVHQRGVDLRRSGS